MNENMIEEEETPAWIGEFLGYDEGERRRRRVDALARVIYPTMWGNGSPAFITKHGTYPSTARAWSNEGLRAVERV